jgi:hypothetical protein
MNRHVSNGVAEFEMDIRLIYEGPLPTENSKVVEVKHSIREALRYQLFDHVRRRPALSLHVSKIRGTEEPSRQEEPDWAAIGRKYRFRGIEFVPLIVGAAHAVCHLDILFLRREESESLITKPKDEYGGDLDNRLKIFLDALRVPLNESEVPASAKPDEFPFCCLLEDDSLITKLSIEADILPGLYKKAEQRHVQINLRASLKLTFMTYYNLLLGSSN